MASSSSCFPDVPETKHDIFISFRGEDVRRSLLSHLAKELDRNEIDVYVDDRLGAGDEISFTLLQAIQEASISLIIFSKDYASSKWCLDELVKIVECMERHQRIVIPVFYNVEPSDVRYQKRTFEEAFGKHQDKFKENMGKVQSWRSALNKAANLSGFHYPSEKYENESKLVDEIVNGVLEKLSHIFPSGSKSLVGIDKNLEPIESLLAIKSREVRILGIWGMGGIGKTTIAEAIFEKYSSQYGGCCILKNVREQSQKQGLSYLCEELVSKLKGPAKTRCTNSRKKVFIVLDDVNSSEQLEHLIGGQICLGPGSRVIVTTRDKQILKNVHAVYEYEVQKLNFKDSLELFCLHAFSKTYPEISYAKLSEMAVDYAKGIPLALKVLGSELNSRSIKVWESELRKLKTYPAKDIYSVLKWSYDGLNDFEKKIFLDITFFFKGELKDDVIRLLDSCGFFADIGIDNLLRKALVTISDDNRIEVHDLIEQMGWEIVRQESINDKGKQSRLRNPEDVYDLLKNNKGTKLVEGIMLDVSQTKDLHLYADTFKKMPNLRIIKFYTLDNSGRRSSNVYIRTDLDSFSDELRYLEWNGYPLNSLPPTFCAEKLVLLSMPNSRVSKLWDGVQDLSNLKEIHLDGCTQLVELPDLTKASNLEKINLGYCKSLCSVHPSILSIHTLQELNFSGCKKLKSLKSEIHLKSLKYLIVLDCFSLEEFSVSSEEMMSLKLETTRIDMLHSSIGRLTKLGRLDLTGLGFESLPEELCFLTSLKELRLCGCKQLIELPRNIKVLSRLKILSLFGCWGLRSLPELPPSIEFLDAGNCLSLETVGVSTKAVLSLGGMRFSFKNCLRLDELSLRDILEDAHLTMLQLVIRDLLESRRHRPRKWILDGSDGAEICYPGSNVPEWFTYKTRHASMTVELDQTDQLLGFFLCCVTPQIDRFDYFLCECHYYLGDDEKDSRYSRTTRFWQTAGGSISDHVFIGYDPFECDRILKNIRECRANDHSTTSHNQKISFEFIARSTPLDRVGFGVQVRPQGCGICPIYVSDIMNHIQKMELELGDKAKKYQGIDLSALKNMVRLKMKKEPIAQSKIFDLMPHSNGNNLDADGNQGVQRNNPLSSASKSIEVKITPKHNM